jgi:lysozyme
MDIYSQLIRDEGLRNFPYRDTTGNLTIGVGRNLSTAGISNDEATMMLQNDVIRVTTELTQAFPWFPDLDSVRQGVLINMAFNMGPGGLSGFHDFLTCVEAEDWQGASTAMLDSLWARQVGARAERLAAQITTGVWQ